MSDLGPPRRDRATRPHPPENAPRDDAPATSREAAEMLYEACLERIAARVSAFVFHGYFEPLQPQGLGPDALTLRAPSAFHRDWVRDHYLDEIRAEVRALSGVSLDVRLELSDGAPTRAVDNAPEPEHVAPGLSAERTRRRAERATAALGDRPRSRPGAQGASVPAGVAEGSGGRGRPGSTDEPARSSGAGSSAPGRRGAGGDVVSLDAHPRRLRGLDGGPARRLNPGYTFDTFVTGPSNRVAYAAGRAVAEHPAARYSPLFLFGGTGLGKTHLLHAIGNAALEEHPGVRVVYMSAEEWVNEYIRDLRHKRFDEFRRRYRGGCDLLLIDDIQFLAGKDASQDEFFHTFNALYDNRRQIVVTSDRYPHEIEGLEERLRTRLGWGLIADIQLPELETRIAIVQRKAEDLGVLLPPEVASYLATCVRSSIRELEGALVRLHAYAQLTREPLTLALAKEHLRPVLGQAAGAALTLDRVLRTVAAYYDLRPADLKSKSRQRQVSRARQTAMYLCRAHLGMSLPEIGRAFGGRDHSTVLTSVRKIDSLRSLDAGVQAVLGKLEQTLL